MLVTTGAEVVAVVVVVIGTAVVVVVVTGSLQHVVSMICLTSSVVRDLL